MNQTLLPRVVLATRNQGKVVELRRILGGTVELVGLDDVTPYEPCPETGATFAENAVAKALEAVERTGLPAVADDSGLAVDAMNGMPGVLSARWAGCHGDDLANLCWRRWATFPTSAAQRASSAPRPTRCPTGGTRS